MSNLHRKGFVSIAAMLLACFTLFLLNPGTASANSPREIKLSYDSSTQTLQAVITHSPVSSGHYVEKVEVKKNGKPVAVQEFKSQPAETFTFTGKVDAAPGDVLEVKASCSRFGSKTEKLKVGQPAAR